jgi:hypothetical protein
MTKLPTRQDETLGGFIVHGLPFPVATDAASLALLKQLAPIRIEQEYKIATSSHGQDIRGSPPPTASSWLQGPGDRLHDATRGHDMASGRRTVDITHLPAKIHAFTVCYLVGGASSRDSFASLVESKREHPAFPALGVELSEASWTGSECQEPKFGRTASRRRTCLSPRNRRDGRWPVPASTKPRLCPDPGAGRTVF